MKKMILILSVATILFITITGVASAAGTAIYLGPIDTFKILNDQITALPSTAFTKVRAAAHQKEVLSYKIQGLIRKVENGAYGSAINNLDQEIRNNIQRWIVAVEQPNLFESIDNAIAAVNNASQSTITTLYGRVAGADADFDCWAWKGIPFAKPPVGTLRWKAPQDPEPWHKIRQYTENYNFCTQSVLNRVYASTTQIQGSEDCLYLDIYGPKTHTRNLPVYFWIHGGGNSSGAANLYPWCSTLAKTSNVIVVIIQYRLGPFGFFTHPALNPGGTIEDKSGNYGVLDQIKALKWVQRNIAGFGGDPNNIMIAGESAGGLNTLNLMISPLARGLFHKAFAESAGGPNIPVSAGVSQANTIIDKLLVADGTCADLTQAAAFHASMSNAQIESYLKNKSDQQILRVMMDATGSIGAISPFIDGTVIPGTLASVFESGNYNKVPVILGSNEYEMKTFIPVILGAVPTSSGYTWSNVYNAIGLAEPRITLDELMPPGSYDRSLYEDCGKYPSLSWKASMVDGLARILREHQDNVYCYWFKWGGIGSGPSPFDFLIGPGHVFELPFFFGWDRCIWQISYTEANKEGRQALTQSMMSYVAAFIVSGNPNQTGSGLPVWEEWSNNAGEPKSIIFDADFTQAKISMMSQEFKKEEVTEQINALPAWERDLIIALLWN